MILVLNAGSSSLKCKLFKKQKAVFSAHVDAIGLKNSRIESSVIDFNKRISNHQEALAAIIHIIQESGTITSLKEITAVGHRVVHGGNMFTEPTVMTKRTLKKLGKISSFAPLHNPPNILGIRSCMEILPHAKNIAVFDTAFHHTIPEKAFRYGISEKWYKKDGIRRYGFHGTSHAYIARTVKKKRLVSCHIGNGSSITAIKNGKSVDTSMGFTPLEGIIMGTRSGNLDPAIPLILMKKYKITSEKLDHILNKESGFAAITGSADLRTIYQKSKKGNAKANLLLDMLSYGIAKYIGAYATIIGGLDAITFTGGIGENAWYIRKSTCDYLKWMGVKLNHTKNKQLTYPHNAEKPTKISTGKVDVVIVPANEELEIARATLAIGL